MIFICLIKFINIIITNEIKYWCMYKCFITRMYKYKEHTLDISIFHTHHSNQWSTFFINEKYGFHENRDIQKCKSYTEKMASIYFKINTLNVVWNIF